MSKIKKFKNDSSRLQDKMRLSKTTKNSHMFNVSENVIPRSITNLPQTGLQNEHMFAQGELKLQQFLSDSYSKSFSLMDRFWAEGIRLLEFSEAKCYELKSDFAEHLNREFQEIDQLKKFKLGNSASKENFEEVSIRRVN